MFILVLVSLIVPIEIIEGKKCSESRWEMLCFFQEKGDSYIAKNVHYMLQNMFQILETCCWFKNDIFKKVKEKRGVCRVI